MAAPRGHVNHSQNEDRLGSCFPVREKGSAVRTESRVRILTGRLRSLVPPGYGTSMICVSSDLSPVTRSTVRMFPTLAA